MQILDIHKLDNTCWLRIYNGRIIVFEMYPFVTVNIVSRVFVTVTANIVSRVFMHSLEWTYVVSSIEALLHSFT